VNITLLKLDNKSLQNIKLLDVWVELQRKPVIEKYKWRFNFRIIILNVVVFGVEIAPANSKWQ